MSGKLDFAALWQSATPTSRREILKRAALAGASAPAIAAILSTPGVSAAPSGSARAGVRAAQGEPKQGGTVTLMGHQEIASLSPDDTGPSIQFIMIAQIHNALIEMDENYQFNPVLAESYEMAPDGLTYTFKLHQGVKFHDGQEFSSADVKYTYEYFMNPDHETIKGVDFAPVASVDAPDPATVIVKLKEPYPAFINKVGTMFILPKHYHEQIGEDAYKGKPVGTGAFKLQEWRASEYTSVVAFDDHFRGRPHLDEVRMNIVPEASVRAIALETGDADCSAWPLVTEDSLRLAQDDRFFVFKSPSMAVNHFPLNNTDPVLSDKAVRQAMMHAIDRQKVMDDIFKGAATLATSNLSPALADYYVADVPTYEYSVDKAKALLDQAGWTASGDAVRQKDGKPLSFTCTVIAGDQARRPEAEVVQQYLRAVGIDMQIEEAPVSTILDGLRKGEMQASLFNWTYGGDDADPEATETLGSNGSNNFSQFKNARVDELLAAGNKEVDKAKRKEIYAEIQKIVADEVPFLYMMFWDIYTPFSKRVKGLPESALASDNIFLSANEWWVE